MSNKNSYPAVDDLRTVLEAMQRAHRAAGPADAALRRDRLTRSVRLIMDNRDALNTAISADFAPRSRYQTLLADVATTVGMLTHAARHVDVWMQPERIDDPAPGVHAWIDPQPLGVVGVISPWNFPLNLAFGPLAGVFAAGNTAMLKPSELSPRTSDLLAELVGRYFEPNELAVVLGDAEVGRAFSALPFDHLVFTGSTTVGRHVMRAAAENLVPVTLELGGKSPVMIDTDADVASAVDRTLSVKTFNAGQICLSPDYVLLPEGQKDTFITAARAFMESAFSTLQSNPDYTAIISPRHFQRLRTVLKDAADKGAQVIPLAPSGETALDEETGKIAPHLVFDVSDDMQIMQEEIFGPLLPVRTYQDPADAVAYINAHPRPLAAYYFGADPDRQRAFARSTTSGGLVINGVMTHVTVDDLPFGGVGASGMGAYHGIHGFRRFTHAKPIVVHESSRQADDRLQAPYAEKLSGLENLLTGTN